MKSRIIKENLSVNTIKKLCYFVKEERYAPDSEIILKGEPALKLIYVVNGEV